jgi:hypothetical protein
MYNKIVRIIQNTNKKKIKIFMRHSGPQEPDLDLRYNFLEMLGPDPDALHTDPQKTSVLGFDAGISGQQCIHLVFGFLCERKTYLLNWLVGGLTGRWGRPRGA